MSMPGCTLPAFTPIGDDNALTVRFWGVRGSVPLCCDQNRKFGGNSPCVEIWCGNRLFIVDAGSGIVPLGMRLLGQDAIRSVDILLSHLHVDHVVGLPFFKPAHREGWTVRTYTGNLNGESGKAALDRMYSPPLFPLMLDQFPCRFEHIGFHAGETLTFADGAQIATCPLDHPGGATAYRFDHGGRRICYVSDLEHREDWPPSQLVDFVAGADLVIFDAMFTEAEYRGCRGWGHSTCAAGLALCKASEAKAMAAFHLNPWHDDAFLEERGKVIEDCLPGSFVAREGMTLSYPALVPVA